MGEEALQRPWAPNMPHIPGLSCWMAWAKAFWPTLSRCLGRRPCSLEVRYDTPATPRTILTFWMVFSFSYVKCSGLQGQTARAGFCSGLFCERKGKGFLAQVVPLPGQAALEPEGQVRHPCNDACLEIFKRSKCPKCHSCPRCQQQ